MATLTFDLREYGPFLARLGERRLMEGARRGALSAALRSVALMQRLTDRAAPANPGGTGTGGAVNSGHFRRAWNASALPDGAELFNDAPYAGVIEGGRRPGTRFPPVEAIARWVQRRLGLSESDAKAAAYVIARAISKRGLRGRKILDGSLSEIRAYVHEEILRELAVEMGSR